MRLTQRYFWISSSTAILAVAGAWGQTASDPNDLLAHSRALRQQFRAQTASAVAGKTPQEEDISLMDVIEKVMALRTPENPAGVNAAHSDRAAGRGVQPTAPQTPETKVDTTIIVQTPPAGTPAVREQRPGAIERLRTLDDKQAILYPSELADALYRAGKSEEAARYYEMALAAVTEDDAAARQWLFFQTANCLRQTDTARAMMLYEKLIELYPNSVWAAAAQARHRILIWRNTRQQELDTRLAGQDNHAK